jgi:hypothetical protein
MCCMILTQDTRLCMAMARRGRKMELGTRAAPKAVSVKIFCILTEEGLRVQ